MKKINIIATGDIIIKQMKRMDTDTTKIITRTKSGVRKINTGRKKKTIKTGT